MVVEDDEALRDLLARELGHELGAYTVVARDGSEALRWGRRLKPSVIILDLSLPNVDGFEVAHRLKADPATREIGIVAVSALTPRDKTRDLALAAGCDEFVPKPFDVEELIETVHRRLLAADREGAQG